MVESFEEERKRKLRKLHETFKNEENEEYNMTSSKTDAISIIAVMIAGLGFLLFIFGFINLQSTKSIDIVTLSGMVIGAILFYAAYKILK